LLLALNQGEKVHRREVHSRYSSPSPSSTIMTPRPPLLPDVRARCRRFFGVRTSTAEGLSRLFIMQQFHCASHRRRPRIVTTHNRYASDIIELRLCRMPSPATLMRCGLSASGVGILPSDRWRQIDGAVVASPGGAVMKRRSGPPIDPDALRSLLIALVTIALVAWAIWELAR
jgi:hypothetical protein